MVSCRAMMGAFGNFGQQGHRLDFAVQKSRATGALIEVSSPWEGGAGLLTWPQLCNVERSGIIASWNNNIQNLRTTQTFGVSFFDAQVVCLEL